VISIRIYRCLDVMTMVQELAGLNGFFLFHIGAVFAGAMGVLGMLLAVLGLYGVVSFNATRRMQLDSTLTVSFRSRRRVASTLMCAAATLAQRMPLPAYR